MSFSGPSSPITVPQFSEAGRGLSYAANTAIAYDGLGNIYIYAVDTNKLTRSLSKYDKNLNLLAGPITVTDFSPQDKLGGMGAAGFVSGGVVVYFIYPAFFSFGDEAFVEYNFAFFVYNTDLTLIQSSGFLATFDAISVATNGNNDFAFLRRDRPSSNQARYYYVDAFSNPFVGGQTQNEFIIATSEFNASNGFVHGITSNWATTKFVALYADLLHGTRMRKFDSSGNFDTGEISVSGINFGSPPDSGMQSLVSMQENSEKILLVNKNGSGVGSAFRVRIYDPDLSATSLDTTVNGSISASSQAIMGGKYLRTGRITFSYIDDRSSSTPQYEAFYLDSSGANISGSPASVVTGIHSALGSAAKIPTANAFERSLYVFDPGKVRFMTLGDEPFVNNANYLISVHTQAFNLDSMYDFSVYISEERSHDFSVATQSTIGVSNSFSIDTSVSYEKNSFFDIFISNDHDQEYSISVDTKKTSIDSHDFSVDILDNISQAHLFSVDLRNTGELSYGLSVHARKTFEHAYSFSVDAQKSRDRAYIFSTVKQLANTDRVHSFSVDKRQALQKSYQISSDIKKSTEQSYSFSVDLISAKTRSHLFSGTVKKANTDSHSMSVVARPTFESSSTFSTTTDKAIAKTFLFSTDIISSEAQSYSFSNISRRTDSESYSVSVDVLLTSNSSSSMSVTTLDVVEKTHQFSCDILHEEALNYSFYVDVLHKEQQDYSFSVDGKAAVSLSHGISVTVLNQESDSHQFSTDILHEKIVNHSFSVDIAHSEQKDYFVSVDAKASISVSHGISVTILGERSGSYDGSVITRRGFNSNVPFSVDILRVTSLDHFLSADVQKNNTEKSSSFSVDSLKAAQKDYSSSIDVLKTSDSISFLSVDTLSSPTVSHLISVDILAPAEDGHSLNVITKQSLINQYDISILIEAPVNIFHSFDVDTFKHNIDSQHSLSAITRNTSNIDHSFSCEIVQTRNESLDSSAFLHKYEGLVRVFKDVPMKPKYRALPQHYNVLTNIGTSAMAVADNGSVLTVWIEDFGINPCSTLPGKHILGRVDSGSFQVIQPTKNLSNVNGWDQVKVCFNPALNGWIMVMQQREALKYSLFDINLNPILEDESIIIFPFGNYDIGCTDDGFLAILDQQHLIVIDTKTQQQFFFTPNKPGRLTVHGTGHIDVIYADTTGLLLDRYNPLTGISLAGVRVLSGYPGLQKFGINNYLGQSVIAFWSGGTMYYEIIDESFNIVIPSTVISIVDQPEVLFVEVAKREGFRSYIIKYGSGNKCQLVRIESNNEIEIINVDATPGTPIAGPDEFSLWHLHVQSNQTLMDLYVTESVYMSLWRIDRETRVFFSQTDSKTGKIVEEIYQTGAAGNKLIGVADVSLFEYLTQPGRTHVNANTDSFVDFLGIADEDSVFIGGPLGSEIAETMQANTNMFNSQVTLLDPVTDVSFVNFVTLPGSDGFSFNDHSPTISIINRNGSFTLQRHISTGQIKDYGIIMRMPLDVAQTQLNKSLLYIAGINIFSSLAAAFVCTQPFKYRLGQSLYMLVVATYPPSTTEYDPGTVGMIETFELADVDINNFVG